MAVTTWDGSSSTDWNTAANWDTGAVPTSSDDVIIPDTSSINNCELSATGGNPKNVNSLKLEANGTLIGNDIAIRVYGEGDGSSGTTNGFAVDIDGIISGDLHLTIQTPSATKLDLMGSSGNIKNLTINHASCDAFLEANTTTTGNLTITLGKLTCTTEAGDARTLNVAGYAEIGPASGSADQATLTATSQDLLLGSGLTSSHALIVNQGGTFVGGSGIHTIGSIDVKNNSNAKCTLTSGNTTVNSEKTGDDRNIVIGGSSTFAHGSGTIIITFAGTTHYDIDKTINNLTINHASAVQKLSDSTNLAGNLTITAGEFNANGRNLEVAGDVNVTGTLTGSSGAMSFGSLTIPSGGTYSATSGTTTITNKASGYSVNVTGTYTANSGTLKITTGSNNLIKILTGVNHLILESATGSVYEWVSNTTIQGNLTINAGRFAHYSPLFSLDVQGDCTINNTGTLTGGSGSIEMNSLTIASGGTYTATSGTTTVTGESGSGVNLSNSGTFTHNLGTVKVTCATQTTLVGFSGTNGFYNYNYEGSGSGEDQVCGGNTDFFGHVIIDSANSEVQMQAHTFNLYGGITIKQGGWDIGSSDESGTINVYGHIRNVGGSVKA